MLNYDMIQDIYHMYEASVFLNKNIMHTHRTRNIRNFYQM